MNIFEIIQRAQPNRIEPFHSQFLADALDHSLNSPNGDVSLFCKVWKLAAPDGWDVPNEATIKPEDIVPDVGRKIDISIRSDKPHMRVLGIEVKTTDGSAERGQLEQYLDDLKRKYPNHNVCVSYLTPLNREWAGDAADSVYAVKVFEEFKGVCSNAKHFAWGDVANILWDGNELWRQHRTYVQECMLPKEREGMSRERNRDFTHFFGEEHTQLFWKALASKGIYAGNNGVVIELEGFRDGLQSFANELIRALEVLLESDKVSHDSEKDDRFSAELRAPFLNSQYRIIHAGLFALSERFRCVWIEGEGRYGVRVAHKEYSSGVSLVTSLGYDRLVVGQRR